MTDTTIFIIFTIILCFFIVCGGILVSRGDMGGIICIAIATLAIGILVGISSKIEEE